MTDQTEKARRAEDAANTLMGDAICAVAHSLKGLPKRFRPQFAGRTMMLLLAAYDDEQTLEQRLRALEAEVRAMRKTLTNSELNKIDPALISDVLIEGFMNDD